MMQILNLRVENDTNCTLSHTINSFSHEFLKCFILDYLKQDLTISTISGVSAKFMHS